jgi:hypothetical protein
MFHGEKKKEEKGMPPDVYVRRRINRELIY